MPEGSLDSEADGINHIGISTHRGLGCPQRRFGYFVAVDKVTRPGGRNTPKQMKTSFAPPCRFSGKDGGKTKVFKRLRLFGLSAPMGQANPQTDRKRKNQWLR